MTASEISDHERVAAKVALVTGAGSGIGRATALKLAEHGAAVVCTDLDPTTAEATWRSIDGLGKQGWGCRLDVTSESEWREVTERIVDEFGRLQIVVNNAGISFASLVTETCVADWRKVMAVNCEGVFLGTKHAVRTMREAKCGGSIINVASVSGVRAQAGASAYCASKAAVIMLSKVAALECQQQGDGVRVNSVSPSGVKTPLWRTMPFFQELMKEKGGEEAAFHAMAGDAQDGRWATSDEAALAILYLASDESAFVTGTNLEFAQGDTA